MSEIVIRSAQHALANVKGITGISFDGKNVIVYVANESVRSHVPLLLAGYPVIVKVTGELKLL